MAKEIEVEIVGRIEKLEEAIKKSREKSTKEFESLADDISSILDQGIGKAALNAAKAILPLAAAIGTIKVAIEAAFEGERIEAINAQFQALSKQAGIAADTLRNDLVGSAAGLVDDTDLIEAANKALIGLGASAEQLPKTLELARKATSLFGGEVVQNFELINQAVASGNTRALRQIGLFIDQEQAVKDYAKALGVSVGAINETGKQQAILNAVLEKGQSVFGNVDLSLNKNKNALQELKVALNDINDSFSTFANSTLGGILNTAISVTATEVRQLADGFKALSKDPETAEQRFKSLSVELEEINKVIEKTGSTIQTTIERGGFGESIITKLDLGGRRAQIENELELLAEAQQKLSARNFRPDAESELPSPFNVEKAQLDAIKVQEIINKAQQDRLASQLAIATQEQERDAIIEQQKVAAAQGFALQRQEFQANEAINNQLTNAQEKLVLEQMEQTHQNNLLAIKTDAAKKNELLTKQLNDTFRQGLANSIAAGVQSIVMSFRTGENAFGNFVKAVAKVMGNLAIQLGTMFIFTGLSIDALKALGGGAAVAAGIGLVAVGTILNSLAGGGCVETPGTGSFANGGGPGGVVGSQPGFIAEQTEFNPAQVGTSVNVTVQGNILDRRESGLEIANIIQEHFNTNGNVIVGSV